MICHVGSKSYGFIDRNDIASAVGRRNGARTAGDDTGRALDVPALLDQTGVGIEAPVQHVRSSRGIRCS